MKKPKSPAKSKELPAVSDVRVLGFEPLLPPETLKKKIKVGEEVVAHVLDGRRQIREALAGKDKRFMVIVGPCSIHDETAAYEYAERLRLLKNKVQGQLLIVMRVYFEKPRTTVGWKGLIYDPTLDGTNDMQLGIRKAREILININSMGILCATEFLDPIVPQYTADLVAWAAIGARTTESQTHREMASGLSMPVGFKNATDGGLQVAVDAMTSSRHKHVFLGIDQNGQTAIVRTAGNPDVHVVLRGGSKPNYGPADIAYTRVLCDIKDGKRLIMVDCSHGNSSKDYRKQPAVYNDVLKQFASGETSILGCMLESHLVEGGQKLEKKLVYGQSITDSCIGWDSTEKLLLESAELLTKAKSKR